MCDRAPRRGHAVVAGHGLHIDLVEEARTNQFAVGRAIQRDASGQSDAPQPGLLAKVPADVQDHALQALLKRGGHILMNGVDWIGRVPARNQVFVEIRARGR